MNNDKHIKEMAESALGSFDGMQRAEPRPFLYTRLMARMQQAPAGFWERCARYLSRPAVALVCLLVVLLVNGLVLINKKTIQNEQQELIADDYNSGEMNTNSSVLFDMEQ